MNKKEKSQLVKKVRNRYKIAGSSSFSRRPLNAIYLHIGNRNAKDILDDPHELGLIRLCYWLSKAGIKYLTQAEKNSNPYKGDIIDIVAITGKEGKEIEVIFKHDDMTTLRRYKDADRILAFVDGEGNIINEAVVKTELGIC